MIDVYVIDRRVIVWCVAFLFNVAPWGLEVYAGPPWRTLFRYSF